MRQNANYLIIDNTDEIVRRLINKSNFPNGGFISQRANPNQLIGALLEAHTISSSAYPSYILMDNSKIDFTSVAISQLLFRPPELPITAFFLFSDVPKGVGKGRNFDYIIFSSALPDESLRKLWERFVHKAGEDWEGFLKTVRGSQDSHFVIEFAVRFAPFSH